MKNLIVWIILISTAAMGVAVAQPDGGEFVAVIKTEQVHVA